MIETLRKLEKAFGGDVRVARRDDRRHDARAAAATSRSMTDTRADEGLGAGAARAPRGMTLRLARPAAGAIRRRSPAWPASSPTA